MILTIATTKGGAGKTTLHRLLIARLHTSVSIAAIDTDINGTLADWLTGVPGAPQVTCHHVVDERRVVRLAQELRKTFDLVLIDTAGAASMAMTNAMAISDFVLVPMQPSLGDVIEALKTLEHIDVAEECRGRELPRAVVMLSLREKSKVGKMVLERIERHQLPMLQSRLSCRVSLQAMSFNAVVPKPGKGADGREVDALIEELARLGAIPKPSYLASQEGNEQEDRRVSRD